MAAHQVLFCPFCRECFEDSSTCPEHELRLVPFDQLTPDPEAREDEGDAAPPTNAEEAHLAPFDPRFGRG
ncbi:MAG TPA: hypothetical protein VG963_26665, partial [Polyangiaceae bacterium]|nr:hypothetical protein [Polyangiaceae bacterium]